jgi:hypothetical protein
VRAGAQRMMAGMSCENHLRELTAPMPVLASIYTVPYIWRFAHAAAGHSAQVQALAHPCVSPARAANTKRVPHGIRQQGPEEDSRWIRQAR